jgi:hypothetical protein
MFFRAGRAARGGTLRASATEAARMTTVARPQSVVIDESHRPLLLVRFVGNVSEADFRGYIDAMTANLARREKTVVIIDSRSAQPPSAASRKLQADWMAAYEAELRAHTIGLAMVMSQPIHRAVLTALLWVRPLPCPHTVVPTMFEAVDWARARFREAGVPFHFEGVLV